MKIQAAVFKRSPAVHPFTRRHKHSRLPHEAIADKMILLFWMLVFLFCGVFMYLCNQDRMQPAFHALFQAYCESRASDFGVFFFASLLPTFGAGLFLFYLGISPVGTVGIGTLLALRCTTMGSLGAYMALAFGKSGLRAFFYGFFPGRSLALCALFLLSGHALKCSNYLKSCLKRDSSLPNGWFFSYMRICVPGLLMTIAATVSDILLQPVLANVLSSSFSSY